MYPWTQQAEKRQAYTAEQKLSIVKEHLIGKKAVSEICETYGIVPSLFYKWQQALFDHGAVALEKKNGGQKRGRVAAGAAPGRRVGEDTGEAGEQARSALGADERAHCAKKKSWELSSAWVEPDKRDAVVDFIQQWSVKAEISRRQLLAWLGLSSSKFYDWSRRYGKVNEHNAWVPRDHWLEPWEKGGDFGLPRAASAGRLPAADVHDDRCRR